MAARQGAEVIIGGVNPQSKLGLLLKVSAERARAEQPPVDGEELRIRVLEKLEGLVGCSLDIRQFLDKGPAYLRTEEGKLAARKMLDFYEDLEVRAKR